MKKFCAALLLFLSTSAFAAVTDQDYINYQIETQTIIYKHAQDPTKMATEIQGIEQKYPIQNQEWKDYFMALQKDPTRMIQLHEQIDAQLKKSGIAPWEEPEQQK